MPKNIVVLSDGTGNSAAALFKTNVYRLYAALDQKPLTPDQAAAGERYQIAYYDDGVGSSSFRPLAIVGGVFGWGLKRNVLDLYAFLCRNYEPGDHIYAFGFSRGAFTIRVLIGLVVTQGILQPGSKERLPYMMIDAYRQYRRNYTNWTAGLLRKLRDGIVALKRRVLRQPVLQPSDRIGLERIEFIGVWDTVAAYGLPLSELTRGVDKWVMPLSMPNYRLSSKVARARHALALDDERDTFHPLLWDETVEEPGHDRLKQVWFTGMHSDVGGGYPDDSLAFVSLRWMLGEAAAVGLRFDPEHVDQVDRTRNAFGTMHNSRQGVAAYYRYQPRKISARTDPPDRMALLMQDPNRRGKGFLTSVEVHDSVLNRIGAGADAYAPIVLPADYNVVSDLPLAGAGGAKLPGTVPPPWREPPDHAGWRAAAQERVWDIVWCRRWVYFTTVIVTVLLFSLPLFQTLYPPSACGGLLCLLSPGIAALGAFLPGFLDFWPASFARSPGFFLLAVVAVVFLRGKGATLSRRIDDSMRDLWRRPAPSSPGAHASWAYRLRSSRAYQRFFQLLKWKIAPHSFGFLVLACLSFLALAVPITFVAAGLNRLQYAGAEDQNRYCPPGEAAPLAGRGVAEGSFSTGQLCWPTGFMLQKGLPYEIVFTVTEDWSDAAIATDPRGFAGSEMPWSSRYLAILGRRVLGAPWFKPVMKIVSPDGDDHLQVLDLERIDRATYSTEFTPGASGKAFLFVNDAIVPLLSSADEYYANNRGAARIELRPLR